MAKREIVGVLYTQKQQPMVVLLQEKDDLVPLFTGTLEDLSHCTPKVAVVKITTVYTSGDVKIGHNLPKMTHNRCGIDLGSITRAGSGYLIIPNTKGLHAVIPNYDPKGRMSVFDLDPVQNDICAH